MPQTTKEYPMSKQFFPGLLPIIGDEKYKQIVARYQELLKNMNFPNTLPFNGT
jgi:hypothetical protein